MLRNCGTVDPELIYATLLPGRNFGTADPWLTYVTFAKLCDVIVVRFGGLWTKFCYVIVV